MVVRCSIFDRLCMSLKPVDWCSSGSVGHTVDKGDAFDGDAKVQASVRKYPAWP